MWFLGLSDVDNSRSVEGRRIETKLLYCDDQSVGIDVGSEYSKEHILNPT